MFCKGGPGVLGFFAGWFDVCGRSRMLAFSVVAGPGGVKSLRRKRVVYYDLSFGWNKIFVGFLAFLVVLRVLGVLRFGGV